MLENYYYQWLLLLNPLPLLEVYNINDNLHEFMKIIYSYDFLQNSCGKNFHTIDSLAELYQPKTISGNELIDNGKYPVYGANGIIGKYNNYNHSEPTIAIACRGASCGELTMTLPYSWITGNAMVVKPKCNFPYNEFIYYTMLFNKPKNYVSGSAQPQLTRDNLKHYKINISNPEKIESFEMIAKKVRTTIQQNDISNQKLIELRDWLLPLLMNGQLTIE